MGIIEVEVLGEIDSYLLRHAISQAEFARRAGVDSSIISKMRHNNQSLTPRLAKAFAKALGKNQDYFINRLIEPDETPSAVSKC